jgi:hypothetical protein
MSIHKHLPPQARRELKEIGCTKGLKLAKIARRDRQSFDCATWLHKAREMPKEQFKHAEKESTGRDTEPAEIIYFKLYKSQIPVIEQAIETAALMLGTDKSRGYCLEMICADFLAGANLDNEDPEVALAVRTTICQISPQPREADVSAPRDREGIMTSVRTKRTRLRLDSGQYDTLRNRVLRRDGWRCQSCGTMSNLEVHHKEFRSQAGDDSEENLITLCNACHASLHDGRSFCVRYYTSPLAWR